MMTAIKLEDVAKAQKDFAEARNQALQMALEQSDPKAAVAAQQSALLNYLQARVRLLSDAKNNSMQQFDDAIAGFQMRIGELNQQMQQAGQPIPAPSIAESAQKRTAIPRRVRKDTGAQKLP